jgi:uncharacterized protein (UPF0548 family)
MIRLGRPSPALLTEFLRSQASSSFTYTAVGATATTPPAGYDLNHTRVRLGSGEAVFLAAKAALERWEQFRLGWVESWPADAPIRAGETVVVIAHFPGLCWLNASRIIHVIDQDRPVRAFGFAYGTLADHIESGEERFMIEWDRDEGGVWYDILAFSRPRHWLVRLGYPLARRSQKRFGRDSATAMKRAAEARSPS